ncbi:methanogenesis marker protein 8 [Methanoculleus sediminis]|uniref:Methanogenesis marker protein 8 n=1 Tax=Methanoculleus sediminis TaxID=1550566 RepID=A0A0H1QY04_9EURY|nr:methanogenesis marker 8 protein [Methanoculleus sediminis]KLK87793.1 methanogenesis marker protein 8 [Methanoculleus sediminis]
MSDRDEHIIEAAGRCRVVIRNGGVVEVGTPQIGDCPLARRFAFPVKEMTTEEIRKNIEERIRSFGMCTPEREVLAGPDFVIFGASELLSSAVRRGDLDAAVIVSDGAGTLVATNPALIQGIGGRMSGLVKTSPIREVIARIEENGGAVLDPATAAIDQAAGVALAAELGHRRIAVTTAIAAEAAAIRERFPGAVIVAVHTTGFSREDAALMARSADLLTACASRHIRDEAAKTALLQAGTSIPVFAMTAAGKGIILGKVAETDQQVIVHGARLPVPGSQSPSPLR